MKLFNTETKKKDVIEGDVIKIYACGPTVYDRAHIGNLRAYLNADILKRTLEYLDYKVDFAMNITDIEDKIIKKSIAEGKKYHEITATYEELFWADLEKLNIKKPQKTPHATDPAVINKMIKIINDLLKKGVAYISDDGSVYFSISKFPKYGRLSGLKRENLKVGARVSQDEYDKENAQDFVLWKAKREGEPSWEAPFGEGRPGWHIECSAMASLELGEQIDIHAGGVDNIFPHHENEIAQTEAYTGKKFVKHWFHGEHLLIDGNRMGKSENNFYSIDQMSENFHVEPLALRMLALQSHYRDKLNFTEKSINDAQNALSNLRNFLNRASQISSKNKSSETFLSVIKNSRNEFRNALSNDLNTPRAMAVIFSFVSETYKASESSEVGGEDVTNFMKEVDRVLGLGLSADYVDSEVKELFRQYQEARAKKDWSGSDRLREQILRLGWVTEDLKCSSILRRK